MTRSGQVFRKRMQVRTGFADPARQKLVGTEMQASFPPWLFRERKLLASFQWHLSHRKCYVPHVVCVRCYASAVSCQLLCASCSLSHDKCDVCKTACL